MMAGLSGVLHRNACTAMFSNNLIIIFSSCQNPGPTAAYGQGQRQDVYAWTWNAN